MDNLTHTLIGALVGEAVARVLPQRRSGLPFEQRRAVFVTTLAIGSNLPDLDLLYTAIYRSKIDYLLYHRGYTHTLIAAVLFAVIAYALCTTWLRSRKQQPSTIDRWQLAFVAVLGPLLHIGMDATNNYGVHPFWPFDNHWFYGDTVFIIEPLLIAACAPLVFVLRTRWARGLAELALLIACGLAFGSGFVPLAGAAVVVAVALLLLAMAWRCSARTAIFSGVATWMIATAMFSLAHYLASTTVKAYVARNDADHTLLDAVLTPSPANPLCWHIITVSVRDDAYVLRRAWLSLRPQSMPARACASFSNVRQATAALVKSTLPNSTALEWQGELSMSRSALRDLVRSNCEAAALMQFARAPWHASSTPIILGDLRYDRELGLGFAEIEIVSAPHCAEHVPPWTPPRSDLLEGTQ